MLSLFVVAILIHGHVFATILFLVFLVSGSLLSSVLRSSVSHSLIDGSRPRYLGRTWWWCIENALLKFSLLNHGSTRTTIRNLEGSVEFRNKV